MDDECQKEAAPDGEVKKKQQKDAELDKKIEALRKKNEVLIRRYQEIEEDRKNAEKIGMAVTSQRPKPDSLTITITKTANEKRIVSESYIGLSDSEEEDEQSFTFRMGKKVELEVTMDNNSKGKRVVSKKAGQDGAHAKMEHSGLTNERRMDHLFAFGRGHRMQIAITMEKECAKRSNERRQMNSTKEQHKRSEKGSSMNCPVETVSEQERLEYMRWKKEREQIDQERLARHKNSKGEWRRAWDAEKTQNMFDGDSNYTGINQDGGRGVFGGKRALDKLAAGDTKGTGKQAQAVIENVSKPLPAISSNAKGKDRLTGRAQRWDTEEWLDSAYVSEGISVLGISECRDYSGFMSQLKNTEVLKGSEQSFKEYNNNNNNDANNNAPGRHEHGRQKRQSECKENVTNPSLHRGFGVPNAYLVTCSEILPEMSSKGFGEGILSETQFHFPSHKRVVKKDTDADLSLESRGVGDYLSVLNSDSELAGLENVRSQGRGKECYTKTQVHCC
ncbi:coiled-coil domain-containing protein 9B isoform X2 [Xenopus laevis]|nr:coiled-coil domain-containing protein 9B isoform X2 [Xenopus laevis]XP_041429311.1 coiled-coil domain-containing protein 9B isoform X2 [Xenopus laevis]XP_041429312.1 coiled-coil domain-containing protein 9B isoform X2 [Xenopus laevis]